MTVGELIKELKKCNQKWVVSLQTSYDLGSFYTLKQLFQSDDDCKLVVLYGEEDDDEEFE